MLDTDPISEFEDVTCLKETAKAILVNINGHTTWIPKSQLALDSDVSRANDSGVLRVSVWIANEKDLDSLIKTPGKHITKPKTKPRQLSSYLTHSDYTKAGFGTIVSILEENMTTEHIKVLVLTPKGVDLTEKYSILLLEALRARSSGYSFSIISAKAEFDQHFAECGGWEPWIKDVIARVDPVSRTPIYRGFILPGEYLGKATAGIVKGALAAKRQVLLFDLANPKLYSVHSLEVLDPTDWQHGYRACT